MSTEEPKRGRGRPLGARNRKDTDDVDLFASQEDMDLVQFLEEIGPQTTVIDVFRKRSDGGRGHVGRAEVTAMAEDPYSYLRETFGPGAYILGFKDSARIYRAWKTLYIEPERVNGVPAVAAPSSSSDEHLKIMREHMQTQQNLILAMIGNMKGPDLTPLLALAKGPDPSAMLTAVVTAFSALRGPQKDEDWLSRAKTIIELAKDLSPDREEKGGDSMWSFARDVGKEVIRRIDGSQGPLALPPAAGSTSTSTRVVIPGIAEGNPGGGEQPDMKAQFEIYLKAGLGYLKEKAKLGKDPELHADFILENDEEPQWGAMLTAIQRGATFEDLLQFDVEIRDNAVYTAWFKSLYDALHTEIFQPVDTSGSGGDASDIAPHAETSQQGAKPPANPKPRK